MKKIVHAVQFKFLTTCHMAVLCALFMGLVSSCSMLNGISFDYPSGENDVAWISVVVENFSGTESTGNTIARTIWGTPSDADDMVFYLYGKASDGTTYRSNALNLTGTGGSLSVAIPRNNWDLFLAGFASAAVAPDKDSIADIASTALLNGGCHADNRRWDPTANFILSDAGLTTAGDVALSLQLDGFSIADRTPAFTVTAQLLNLDMTTFADLTLTEVTGGEEWSATASAVPAGNYYLKVAFTRVIQEYNEFGEPGARYTEEHLFVEVVHVVPGNGCAADVAIPDIVGTF